MMPLLRVMYAPLDYIHPQRFKKPVESLSGSLQQAINHHLIQQHDLPTALDFAISSGDISQSLVTDWKLLPKAAWLLGCKIARGGLAIGGQFAALPAVAQRFIALPVPCAAYPSDTIVVARPDLELIGARYLYQLQPYLPAALAKRLPLVFGPDSEQANSTADKVLSELPMNRSLFTFAFDYARSDDAKNSGD